MRRYDIEPPKNNWRGVDTLKVEWCFVCNRTHSIKFMDDRLQAVCRACAREIKKSQKELDR